MLSRKSHAEAVYQNIIRLLDIHPFPVERSSEFDGRFVLRVLERRIREDEELATLLWGNLQSTLNPTAKIVLPTLLLGTPTRTLDTTYWCAEELERQLSAAATPEIGFDWTNFALRPVAHVLLELTTRSR